MNDLNVVILLDKSPLIVFVYFSRQIMNNDYVNIVIRMKQTLLVDLMLFYIWHLTGIEMVKYVPGQYHRVLHCCTISIVINEQTAMAVDILVSSSDVTSRKPPCGSTGPKHDHSLEFNF